MSKFELVVLETPCQSWENKETQAMFTKMALMKIKGYQYEYGPRVLPVDDYDFIGANLLICENIGGELIPVSGTKIVKYSHCRYYNRKFPPVELVGSGGNNQCQAAMLNIVDEVSATQKDITYAYAWTTVPEFRKTMYSSLLRKMVIGFWILYQFNEKIKDFFVSGTLKIKTDKFFLDMGCVPVTDNSYYYLKGIYNEKALMMKNSTFSDAILKDIEELRPMWNNRIIVGTHRPVLQ